MTGALFARPAGVEQIDRRALAHQLMRTVEGEVRSGWWCRSPRAT
jgi:hypothetical protein